MLHDLGLAFHSKEELVIITLLENQKNGDHRAIVNRWILLAFMKNLPGSGLLAPKGGLIECCGNFWRKRT
jgi:hypothetical protein